HPSVWRKLCAWQSIILIERLPTTMGTSSVLCAHDAEKQWNLERAMYPRKPRTKTVISSASTAETTRLRSSALACSKNIAGGVSPISLIEQHRNCSCAHFPERLGFGRPRVLSVIAVYKKTHCSNATTASPR